MKEFIEKLIENLDKLITDTYYKSVDGSASAGIENGAYRNVKKIVNQLAEEYQKVYEEKLSEEWITGFAIGATDGWIPCSERLPEYSDCYNVTVGVSNEMGYYECVKAFNYVKKQGEEGKWVVPKDLFSTYSVIAWQNTPAPYKEGE